MYLEPGQERDEGIGVGKILLGLAAFTLFHKASIRGLEGLSRFITRKGLSLIRSYAGPGMKRGVNNLVRRAVRFPSYATANRIAGRTKGVREITEANLGLGDLLRPLTRDFLGALSRRSPRAASLIHKGSSSYTNLVKARAKHLKRAGITGRDFTSAIRGQFHPGDIDTRRRLLSSYFRHDGGFSKRFMGSALRWSSEYAKSVPGFYIAEQALGVFSGDDHIERPPIYDIPGHLAGMVRFGVEFAPFDIAFRGLGKVFVHGKDTIAEQGRRYIASRPGTRDTFRKLFATDGMLGHLRSYTKAFGRAYTEQRRHGWGIEIQPLRFDTKAYNIPELIRKTIRYQKDIGRSTFGLEAEMNQILSTIHSATYVNLNTPSDLFKSMAGDIHIQKAFTEILEKRARKPSVTMLQHILSAQSKKTTTFEMIEKFATENKWTPELIDSVKGMIPNKELYFGKNIFQQGDFRMLTAAFAAERVTSLLGKFRVPFIGWMPFQRAAAQRKQGAFEVIEPGRKILRASNIPDDMYSKVEAFGPDVEEAFVRIGNKFFQISPKAQYEPVRPFTDEFGNILKGEMLVLSPGQKAGMVTESIRRGTGEEKNWLSRMRSKFELGYSSSFVGGRLKNWVMRGSNPRAPENLVRDEYLFSKMVRNGIVDPDGPNGVLFGQWVSTLKKHFGSVENDAFEILSRRTDLRDELLRLMPVQSKRTPIDLDNPSVLMETLTDMIGQVHDVQTGITKLGRGPWGQRAATDIQQVLGLMHGTKDPRYIWDSRASIVGQSDAISTADWLKGQYFKQLIYDSRISKSKTNKILGLDQGFMDRAFTAIDRSRVGARESVLLKSLFVGTSLDMALAKATKNISQGSKIVEMNAIRGVLKDHWEPIQELFNTRIFGRQAFQELQSSAEMISRGSLSSLTDNRLWLIQQHGGRNTIAPGFLDEMKALYSLHDSGLGEPYITRNSIRFNQWAIRPLNRTLSYVGLDLAYTSNAEFVRKFLFKRLLALPAAIYGYRAIDSTIQSAPWLNDTLLDDGITVAGADLIAQTNLMRAGLFDSFGVTEASRYLEGLMPGSVESPAAKILRAAVPPMLGRQLGGAKGFAMGLGVSALTGFGLPDLTRTREELEDIYEGREMVPVRSGRFWELCVAEHAKIRTLDGIKFAADIKKDDIVINQYGENVCVKDVSSRSLNPGEAIYELTTLLFPSWPLLCTGDHDILIKNKSGEHIWQKAKNITTSDYLAVPLKTFDRRLLKDIDFDGNDVLFKFGQIIAAFVSNGALLRDGGVVFAFTRDQLDTAYNTYVCLSKVFDIDPEIKITDKPRGFIISFKNGKAREAILKLFGYNRSISEKCYHIGEMFRDGFISGLVRSCGFLDNYCLGLSFEECHDTGVIFIIDALLSIGVIPKHERREVDGIMKDIFMIDNRFLISLFKNCSGIEPDIVPKYQGKSVGGPHIENGYLYYGITKRRRIEYTKKVYDFWVEEGESYSSPYGVYHNSKGPFEGGRITSWVPSWYTRIKSQYRYTDSALGSRMESLLYTGPLSTLGITDPYHYERCVVDGTPILREDGYTNINNIKKGDKVYTHEGLWKPVLNIWAQSISESVISLHTIGLPNSTTVEHKYYTVTPTQKVAWERADQLTTDHWMIFPVQDFFNTRFIDLQDIFPMNPVDTNKLYNASKTEFLPKRIPLDYSFGLFVGLYLSRLKYSNRPFELGGKYVRFNEVDSLARDLGRKIFKTDYFALMKNKLFREFMKRFGYTGNLKLDSKLFLCNKDFCIGLLKGVFYHEGGRYFPIADRYIVTTILSTLIAFGIYAEIIDKKGNLVFKFTEDQQSNLERLLSGKSFNPCSDDNVRFTEDIVYFRVQRVEKEMFVGRIYDIEIEGSHSFAGECCIYHNTRFYERPYPLTSPPFHNVPIIGPALDATIGRFVKPQRLMHEDDLRVLESGIPEDQLNRLASTSVVQPSQFTKTYEGNILGRSDKKLPSLQYAYGESLYRMTEAIGLRGYMIQSLLGQEGTNQYDPKYADASTITSHGSQFWDMQLGGAGGLSEAIRRFYPRSRYMNMVNPIRNTQPTWLPRDFQYGDPLGSLEAGLLRLPSSSYEATHPVKHTFPISLEYIGYEPREQAERLLQIDRGDLVDVYHTGAVRELVKRTLARNNILLKRDVPIFDPWNKIDGHIDAIINMQGTEVPLQIKASTVERLGSMNQPMPADVSQLNFILRMYKKRVGQIQYVAYDDPNVQKTFTLEYSHERFRKDMTRTGQAIQLAAKMLREGVGYSGETYSYPDRLIILANVAPWSDEYKQTLNHVRTLNKYGRLTQEDQSKVRKAQRMRDSMMRQYDLYPTRFSLDKIMSPDSEYNLMSDNVHIKAASEYSLLERMLGSAWESFITTRIPFISRFYGVRTPEQMYEDVNMASQTSMWNQPMRDFVVPASRSFLASNDPFEATRKGAFAGAMFGPPGVVIGAGIGAIYGTTRATILPGNYIPDEVERRREITTYFDSLKYMKGIQLYQETGDPEYLREAKSTVFGLSNQSTPKELYAATPKLERPFLWIFSQVEDEKERRDILKKVSPTMASILQTVWKRNDKTPGMNIEEYTSHNSLPHQGWSGWRPEIPLEDVQLVTVENEGFNAYDFGIGWKDQRTRMHNSPYQVDPIDLSHVGGANANPPPISISSVRNRLIDLLASLGVSRPNVTLIQNGSDSTFVNLQLRV